MKPLHQCRLYTFIDLAYPQGRSPAQWARLLGQGGSDLVQLRAKDSQPEEILKLAREVLPILREFGTGLVINDYPEVARAAGADLCHLGQEDFFKRGFTAKHQVLPSSAGLGLGISTHAPEQAERSAGAGADYLAIGPVYPTPTKPEAWPVTLEYVRWAAARVRIPWFAIGGLNLENLEAVLEAGARRVCLVSAILRARDPVEACQRVKERLLSVPF